jgi:phosphoribosylformylglycinamidine synthase
MAGGLGLTLDPPPSGLAPGSTAHGWWFGEDQARYLIETDAILSVQLPALEAGVPVQRVGTVARGTGASGTVASGTVASGTIEGAALTLPGGNAISVAQLKTAHEAWLPGYMHQG